MMSSAEAVATHMAESRLFCGICGAKFASSEDGYCGICGNDTRPNHSSRTFRRSLRMVLVLPAFVIGILVPGLLVRISTELAIPGGGTWLLPMAELGQSMSDGAFSVLLPWWAAPHSKQLISVIAGVLTICFVAFFMIDSLTTGYFDGVGSGTVLWQFILALVTGASAGIIVLYTKSQSN